MVVLVVIAVVNSAIGAAYYLRIAAACYLRDADGQSRLSGDFMLRVGLGICGAAMVVLFVIPKPLADRARHAAAAAHPRTGTPVFVLGLPPS
jgi:NADH:ubiquinone oxidoreductase subunit 2 (subunit N)